MTKSLTFAAACLLAAPLSAQMPMVTGNLDYLSTPPSDLSAGAEADSFDMIGFQELNDFTLPDNVEIDARDPGLYDDPGDRMDLVVDIGKTIDSYFFHYDTVELDLFESASATFDKPIVGVITDAFSLDSSDVLGPGSTAYPTGNMMRGMTLAQGESFTISGDGRTITFNGFNNDVGDVDQVRVFTQSAVPEPSTYGILAVAGLIGLIAVRRRSLKRQS